MESRKLQVNRKDMKNEVKSLTYFFYFGIIILKSQRHVPKERRT